VEIIKVSFIFAQLTRKDMKVKLRH